MSGAKAFVNMTPREKRSYLLGVDAVHLADEAIGVINELRDRFVTDPDANELFEVFGVVMGRIRKVGEALSSGEPPSSLAQLDLHNELKRHMQRMGLILDVHYRALYSVTDGVPPSVEEFIEESHAKTQRRKEEKERV